MEPWAFGNPTPDAQEGRNHLPKQYAQRAIKDLSPEEAAVLGAKYKPTCDHQWRCHDALPDGAVQLYEDTPNEYTPGALVRPSRKGVN